MKPRAVATLGVFDGVHLGHRAVVERAAARARDCGGIVVAYTFDPPPGAVLRGMPPHPALTLLGERTRLLRAAGGDEVRVLRFTPTLAAKTARRFLEEHVRADYRLERLVVGYDFALGRDREGTVPVLEAMGSGMGFGVEAVEALEVEGSAVSSTRVRRALEGGDVETAARLLGRPYRLGGRVVPGRARGRTLGFPTANVAVPPGKLRPAHGVYAVRVHGVPGGSRGGVANLGVRPTFEEEGESLEVHLLDWDRNLLGMGLGVDLIARLRPERKFNSEMELRDQIEADAEAARRWLAPAPGGGKA